MDERERLLEQIMAYDFAMIDLQLFLDTHPSDVNALQDYRVSFEESERLRRVYTENFGPLSPRYLPNPNCWQWIDKPWPWERSV